MEVRWSQVGRLFVGDSQVGCLTPVSFQLWHSVVDGCLELPEPACAGRSRHLRCRNPFMVLEVKHKKVEALYKQF